MTTSTASPRISRNALAHLLMLFVVVVWGSTFVLVKQALAHIAPQWFNALRMIVGFVCLALIYRRHWRGLTRQVWLFGAAAGACLAGGYMFQTQGLVYTTATDSAFVTALMVVMVPILVYVPGLRAPGSATPEWPAWTGALLALLGVALLTLPAPAQWTHLFTASGGMENWGNLLTLVCALGFALYVITLARASGRVQFEQLVLLQIGFAMVFLTAGAWILEPPASHALARAFLPGSPLTQPLVLCALLVTGILATAAAFTIQTWAQQVIPATNIAVILALEPVFAWLTAFAVLQERLDLRRAAGALLVLLGVLVTDLLPRWNCRQAAGKIAKSAAE